MKIIETKWFIQVLQKFNLILLIDLNDRSHCCHDRQIYFLREKRIIEENRPQFSLFDIQMTMTDLKVE